MSPKLSPPSVGDIMAGQGNAVDSRYHLSAATRRQLNKVFPTHWSFLLGEIAMYSFVVLLLTGVYLTLFFDPSMQDVTYNGVYEPLRGVGMSKAFASALDISFEVRGGLFVRQVHHWAALMFSASIMVHLARIFFTGAFRRPREANWIIGSLLLILSMFEGYFGYSLPDDLLSGIGLRAALSSITMGMPGIGTWLHWADRSTRDRVTFLSRVLPRERIALVVTYRTDALHRRHPLRPVVAELQRLPSVTAIDLRPLSAVAMAEHLTALSGGLLTWP